MYNWIHLVEESTPGCSNMTLSCLLRFSNHCLWFPLWNPSLLSLSSILNRAHHIHTALIIPFSSANSDLYPIPWPQQVGGLMWGGHSASETSCCSTLTGSLPQCWGRKRRIRGRVHSLLNLSFIPQFPQPWLTTNSCSILARARPAQHSFDSGSLTWQTACLEGSTKWLNFD